MHKDRKFSLRHFTEEAGCVIPVEEVEEAVGPITCEERMGNELLRANEVESLAPIIGLNGQPFCEDPYFGGMSDHQAAQRAFALAEISSASMCK